MFDITLDRLGDPIKVNLRDSNKARHIAIKLTARGVELVLPVKADYKIAYEFLYSKEQWIRQRLHKNKFFKDLPKNHIMLFGELYEITKINSKVPKIYIVGNKIIIEAPEYLHSKFLQDYIGKQLLAKVVEQAKTISELYQLNYNYIKLIDSKSKWGSCSSKKNLTFNWRLAFAPSFIAEYVVAHEMAHLKEMNHSPKFWSLVEKIFPNYKIAKKWLKDNGNSLHNIFDKSAFLK